MAFLAAVVAPETSKASITTQSNGKVRILAPTITSDHREKVSNAVGNNSDDKSIQLCAYKRADIIRTRATAAESDSVCDRCEMDGTCVLLAHRSSRVHSDCCISWQALSSSLTINTIPAGSCTTVPRSCSSCKQRETSSRDTKLSWQRTVVKHMTRQVDRMKRFEGYWVWRVRIPRADLRYSFSTRQIYEQRSLRLGSCSSLGEANFLRRGRSTRCCTSRGGI